MVDLAPVVLFIYNRPDHTRRTLEALSANTLAAESDLIIYADGPKKPGYRQSVEAARTVARGARGFRSVTMIEREHNLGLANSIIGGVTEVCRSHGRVIVVEDDLIVAPSFLSFLNTGLDRYANEDRVLQISGYAYPAHEFSGPPAFFLPMISCWGWAIWARAWAHFDPAMSALRILDQDTAARRRFNIDDSYDYYTMACQQLSGILDSWGVRWQLSLFAHDGLVLYPRRSLVSNTGVDASGTHGRGLAAFQAALSPAPVDTNNMEWPAKIATDDLAFDQVKGLLQAHRPGLLRRLIERIRA